jgi:putative ABC transport system substrate-binding protein
VKRRDFITLLSGAAVTWPVTASAQRPAMPVIGFLNVGSPETFAPYVVAFQRGLAEVGYSEGRNVAIEYHWARGQYDRLPSLAADLVSKRVAVIAANGGGVAALAAKAASLTVPIVFTFGDGDPVQYGLVASVNRPGGNITGVTVPITTPVHDDVEIEMAITALGREPGGGLVVMPDTFAVVHRAPIILAAARNNVPGVYPLSYFVRDGGLLSYGPDPVDTFRRAASYVDRILRGEKPGDLSVQFPIKFEMVVNLKTAKALGLTVPQSLLLRADEVIE